MSNLTKTLKNRLNIRLSDIASTESIEVENFFELSDSIHRFDSLSEFRKHLREGALLNINVIASKALSIPQGEYAVWTTDAGHTVLVPTPSASGDLVNRESDQYEIHTNKLLGSWNRVSRAILERNDGSENLKQGSDKEHFDTAPIDQPDGPYTFGKPVGRSQLWQAMTDRGIGVDELADMVGVDKSTISRLLRRVQKGKEEPGGRNPSAQLAMKIADALGVPVDTVMPPESEILNKKSNKKSGTRGSGRQGTMSASRNGNSSAGGGESGDNQYD